MREGDLLDSIYHFKGQSHPETPQTLPEYHPTTYLSTLWPSDVDTKLIIKTGRFLQHKECVESKEK